MCLAHSGVNEINVSMLRQLPGPLEQIQLPCPTPRGGGACLNIFIFWGDLLPSLVRARVLFIYKNFTVLDFLGNVIANLNTITPNLDNDILLIVFNLCRGAVATVDSLFSSLFHRIERFTAHHPRGFGNFIGRT